MNRLVLVVSCLLSIVSSVGEGGNPLVVVAVMVVLGRPAHHDIGHAGPDAARRGHGRASNGRRQPPTTLRTTSGRSWPAVIGSCECVSVSIYRPAGGGTSTRCRARSARGLIENG